MFPLLPSHVFGFHHKKKKKPQGGVFSPRAVFQQEKKIVRLWHRANYVCSKLRIFGEFSDCRISLASVNVLYWENIVLPRRNQRFVQIDVLFLLPRSLF